MRSTSGRHLPHHPLYLRVWSNKEASQQTHGCFSRFLKQDFNHQLCHVSSTLHDAIFCPTLSNKEAWANCRQVFLIFSTRCRNLTYWCEKSYNFHSSVQWFIGENMCMWWACTWFLRLTHLKCITAVYWRPQVCDLLENHKINNVASIKTSPASFVWSFPHVRNHHLDVSKAPLLKSCLVLKAKTRNS